MTEKPCGKSAIGSRVDASCAPVYWAGIVADADTDGAADAGCEALADEAGAPAEHAATPSRTTTAADAQVNTRNDMPAPISRTRTKTRPGFKRFDSVPIQVHDLDGCGIPAETYWTPPPTRGRTRSQFPTSQLRRGRRPTMIVACFPLLRRGLCMIVCCLPLDTTFSTHDHGPPPRVWYQCDVSGCRGGRDEAEAAATHRTGPALRAIAAGRWGPRPPRRINRSA